MIETTDPKADRPLGDVPEFQQPLQGWSRYVAEAVMIHGEVIE